ncbi:erythroid differentiation-related factor 1-like isoform X3 [Dysidea avara]|uniref:erythroid differentiation-related factor 1-like isoform X3 n=1 Tax=Dysidea avara TaxID=196820 RepID=UPI003327EB8F
MATKQDHSPPASVNSLTVLKLSQFEFSDDEPVNLGHPPPNWLHDGSVGALSVYNYSDSKHPSSISLSHENSDLVGKVDVVSDARNIKKLLKMPYSSSHVSMAVHRVDQTLLIDEFSHTASASSSSNFDRLCKEGKLPNVERKRKDPAHVQHKALYSKLLYHSAETSPSQELIPLPYHSKELACQSSDPSTLQPSTETTERDCDSVAVAEHPQESKTTEHLEESNTSDFIFPCQPDTPKPRFTQKVTWSFEDIRMLLGSNLPIFGNDSQPAVSIRLCDMNKPITVLTGLDYWLDNLMCNVPQVAMCYHLNGIVQRYEVIDTEDIPHLENSKFSSQVIYDVAQNILSFLKANCTKEGHTYWLFKGSGDDVVKLYDLTSVCYDKPGSYEQNPFSTPVAILLYQVAKNMLQTFTEKPEHELASAKHLLENCIKLLDAKLHPELVTSAYYLLNELYLFGCIETDVESTSGAADDEASNTNQDKVLNIVSNHESSLLPSVTSNSVFVSMLKDGRVVPAPPKLFHLSLGDSVQRSTSALEYIGKAFASAEFIPENDSQYLTVEKLFKRAALSYSNLAENCLLSKQFGKCLESCGNSLRCLECCGHLCSSGSDAGMKEKLQLQQRAWLYCGDTHSLVAKTTNFPVDFPYKCVNDDTNPIMSAVQKWSNDLSEDKSVCLQLHGDLEATLIASLDSYKHAETCGDKGKDSTMQQRLGNAWNELGVYYMKATFVMDYAKDVKLVEKYWKSSYSCLTDGLACFDVCNDIPNRALVSANLGRLMRQCAAVFSSLATDQNEEFSQQEKVYYDKAISYYQSALQILKNRHSHTDIWSSIQYDLSGVCYAYGSLLQDRAPLLRLSTQEVEREVLQILLKTLQHTEPELTHCVSDSPRYVGLCLRTGDSHYRLASLYHHSIRSGSQGTQQKVKQARGQAEKHYRKALNSYILEHHYWKILQVHIEYASLQELQQIKITTLYAEISLAM